MMENLFDCLCFMLLTPANRRRFVDLEGTELMILMLRQRRLSQRGALKCLSYATSAPSGEAVCVRIVDALGLRVLFPIFMQVPRAAVRMWSAVVPLTHGRPPCSPWRRQRSGATQRRTLMVRNGCGGQAASSSGALAHPCCRMRHDVRTEYIVSIIASLFGALTDATGRMRLLNKFVEDAFAKCDRLIELYMAYLGRVRQCEASLAAGWQARAADHALPAAAVSDGPRSAPAPTPPTPRDDRIGPMSRMQNMYCSWKTGSLHCN